MRSLALIFFMYEQATALSLMSGAGAATAQRAATPNMVAEPKASDILAEILEFKRMQADMTGVVTPTNIKMPPPAPAPPPPAPAPTVRVDTPVAVASWYDSGLRLASAPDAQLAESSVAAAPPAPPPLPPPPTTMSTAAFAELQVAAELYSLSAPAALEYLSSGAAEKMGVEPATIASCIDVLAAVPTDGSTVDADARLVDVASWYDAGKRLIYPKLVGPPAYHPSAGPWPAKPKYWPMLGGVNKPKPKPVGGLPPCVFATVVKSWYDAGLRLGPVSVDTTAAAVDTTAAAVDTTAAVASWYDNGGRLVAASVAAAPPAVAATPQPPAEMASLEASAILAEMLAFKRAKAD